MQRTRSVTAGYVILGLLGLSDALGFLLAGGDDGLLSWSTLSERSWGCSPLVRCTRYSDRVDKAARRLGR